MHKPFAISLLHGLWKNKPEISKGSDAMKTFRIQAITYLIAAKGVHQV